MKREKDWIRIPVLVAAAATGFGGSATADSLDSPPIGRWTTHNMGATLNTAYHEAFSTVTRDERTIYFASNRPGGYGPSDPDIPWPMASYDIYVAHRSSRHAPWGPPVLLGPNINTGASEHSVSLSPDGRSMYFASDRPGGCGGLDIYVSYRSNPHDDHGWGPPSNLGCTVNSEYIESCPVFHVDQQGVARLYFTRSNLDEPGADFPTQLAALDFFVSERLGPGTWSEPTVTPQSTEYQDSHYDPVHGYIWGNYPMGFGGGDIWVSLVKGGVRTNPINLGPYVNTAYDEQIPTASADGRRLYYASDRPGGFGGADLYMSRLRRNHGHGHGHGHGH